MGLEGDGVEEKGAGEARTATLESDFLLPNMIKAVRGLRAGGVRVWAMIEIRHLQSSAQRWRSLEMFWGEYTGVENGLGGIVKVRVAEE